jgi:hypothetical protein
LSASYSVCAMKHHGTGKHRMPSQARLAKNSFDLLASAAVRLLFHLACASPEKQKSNEFLPGSLIVEKVALAGLLDGAHTVTLS